MVLDALPKPSLILTVHRKVIKGQVSDPSTYTLSHINLLNCLNRIAVITNSPPAHLSGHGPIPVQGTKSDDL